VEGKKMKKSCKKISRQLNETSFETEKEFNYKELMFHYGIFGWAFGNVCVCATPFIHIECFFFTFQPFSYTIYSVFFSFITFSLLYSYK
jgi:hypothetical protein